MNIFQYLQSIGVHINNVKILYHLQRLHENSIKIESLQKARIRATSAETKNILDLAIAIWQRYQRATFQQ